MDAVPSASAPQSTELLDKSLLTPEKSPDLEAGQEANLLYPTVGNENALRWGLIQKVYGIVAAQLILTAVVGSVFTVNVDAQLFALTSPTFQILALVLPFAMLIPLYIWRQSHPANLVLLALWTASLSVTVGLTCSLYNGVVVAEALALTGAVVVGLTAYTFHAVKKGLDFSFMGPMLFSSLLVLIVWGFLQMFFPPGPIGDTIFSLIGAIVFSLFIVYDTDALIKRYSYDEFVWASVNLYLDIINLFLYILRMLDRFR